MIFEGCPGGAQVEGPTRWVVSGHFLVSSKQLPNTRLLICKLLKAEKADTTLVLSDLKHDFQFFIF